MWMLCEAGKVLQEGGSEVCWEDSLPLPADGVTYDERPPELAFGSPRLSWFRGQVEHSGCSGALGKVREVPGTGVAAAT